MILKMIGVKYIKADTKDISKTLKLYKKKIATHFFISENFLEYIKVFLKMNECISSNSIGSHAVFNFCLSNKIKLIYSATSAVIRK